MGHDHPELDDHRLLEQMLTIRADEDAIVAGSAACSVPGTCTSVGQEAAAVGVVKALTTDDLILTNHRSGAKAVRKTAKS